MAALAVLGFLAEAALANFLRRILAVAALAVLLGFLAVAALAVAKLPFVEVTLVHPHPAIFLDAALLLEKALEALTEPASRIRVAYPD